jgi:mRNA-degrading endonuclease RelE of RelBE toxin-antitoxin system
MAYRVIINGLVKQQLAALPGNIKAMARQAIATLINDPMPPRSKELVGHPGHYRLHIGNQYRLVWQIYPENRTIVIEYIGPKPPDLYERIGLGRPTPK